MIWYIITAWSTNYRQIVFCFDIQVCIASSNDTDVYDETLSWPANHDWWFKRYLDNKLECKLLMKCCNCEITTYNFINMKITQTQEQRYRLRSQYVSRYYYLQSFFKSTFYLLNWLIDLNSVKVNKQNCWTLIVILQYKN